MRNYLNILQKLLVIVGVSLLLTSCWQSKPLGPASVPSSKDLKGKLAKDNIERELLYSSFFLDVGDVIFISVYNEPELKGTYQIFPNCKIQFPLIGGVKVCGKTPDRLASEIADRLHAKYLQQRPSVVVEVKQFNSKKIHVLGEVNKPGRFTYTPGMTLVEAIAMAGGFTKLAAYNDTRLIRNINGKKFVYRIPLGGLGQKKLPDIHLRPGDVIFVPKSWF